MCASASSFRSDGQAGCTTENTAGYRGPTVCRENAEAILNMHTNSIGFKDRL